MPSGKLKLYDKFQKNLADDVISLSTDSLKLAIVTSASNAETMTLEFYSQITSELPTANGYTQGGEVIANITISEAAGVTTINGDNFDIIATGGSIIGRHLVLYSDTSVGKCLIGTFLAVDPADDLTALDSQHFIVDWNANGIFQLSADNA